MGRANIYANLPTVVYIEGVHDGGESYRGHASERCPHCDAEGRYIYKFRCDDGKMYGAMKGCFGKFPKSKLVVEHERLIEKQKDFRQKGWKFPWYEQAALDAIIACGKGEGSEDQAWGAVQEATRQKRLYAERVASRWGR